MLDPSSSEDDSELEGERPPPDSVLLAPGTDPSLAPPAAAREPRGPGEGGPAVGGRCSPSPSVRSEGREEQERLQREERERRGRLQLYVFIIRCIAHPFNAKQPTDMARRQQKPDEQTCSGEATASSYKTRDNSRITHEVETETIKDTRGRICHRFCVKFGQAVGSLLSETGVVFDIIELYFSTCVDSERRIPAWTGNMEFCKIYCSL